MIDMIILRNGAVYAVRGQINEFHDGSFKVKSIEFVSERSPREYGCNGYAVLIAKQDSVEIEHRIFIPMHMIEKVKV